MRRLNRGTPGALVIALILWVGGPWLVARADTARERRLDALQDEMKRAETLIAEANKQKIKLVGIHTGGEDRRGEVSSKLINLVAPKMSYLIVREDGNKDGLFTKLAGEHKIPLTLIKGTQELSDLFKELFKL